MRVLCMTMLLASLLPAADLNSGDVRTSVEKAVPLLQKASPFFWHHTGCISCHQNVLPSMAVTMAHDRGFTIDEVAAGNMLKETADYVGARADRMFQGLTPPGGEDTMSYVLFALSEAHFPGNAGTDAGVRYLKMRQSDDGRWTIRAHRPPLESSSIDLTAVTIRVLQVYAPPGQRAEYAKSVARAARWLDETEARNTDEAALRILGLVWADAAPVSVAKGKISLARAQHPDGGWSQLPALESDAYATGEALVALHATGMKTTDRVYEKGVAFLIRTQLADGSWLVKSRSVPAQPYFESGFPHGKDQWISSAGTSWAITALALTRR